MHAAMRQKRCPAAEADMTLALNLKHAKQYRDLGWLLWKHGGVDLVQRAGLSDLVRETAGDSTRADTEDSASLAADLEKLGPTYIKLGQLLSTRPDLLPPAYLDALSRLQDDVAPFPFAEVKAIVTAELGVRLSKPFERFDATPMAAASLGQVHRARLRDGREVVVKVQRPDIRERIVDELDALCEVSEFIDRNTHTGRQYEFRPMVDALRKSLLHELDYRREARNLKRLEANLRGFERIIVPTPVDGFTTAKVLTMEYIRGRKITAITPLRRLELDGEDLVEELFRAYLKQILIDGFFHADPHPGNVFLTDDNTIALIDLGMVAHVPATARDNFLKLILAVSEGLGDKVAQVTLAMGAKRDDYDEAQFFRRVNELTLEHENASLGQLDVGRATLEIKRLAAECGVSLPPEMTMIGKALLNLDQIGRTLAPGFNPTAAIRSHSGDIMQQKLRASLAPERMLSSALEVKETLEELPGRLNTILERVANNDLSVKVDAFDEETLIEGMQKIANRITMGLVLAALIVGAAMLMDVPTQFRILGYPALPMIFFGLAAGGGIVLIGHILLHDIRRRRKR